MYHNSCAANGPKEILCFSLLARRLLVLMGPLISDVVGALWWEVLSTSATDEWALWLHVQKWWVFLSSCDLFIWQLPNITKYTSDVLFVNVLVIPHRALQWKFPQDKLKRKLFKPWEGKIIQYSYCCSLRGSSLFCFPFPPSFSSKPGPILLPNWDENTSFSNRVKKVSRLHSIPIRFNHTSIISWTQTSINYTRESSFI